MPSRFVKIVVQYHITKTHTIILPIAVVCFYVVLLGFYSVFYISKGHHTRGIIALFMTVTSVITAVGERVGFAWGFTESVTALEILIYYFFLASIDLSKTQTALFENRLDLERQRNKLLVAQMQPHFIFNSLVTIQALCYTDSEAAADYIEVFGDYVTQYSIAEETRGYLAMMYGRGLTHE